MTTKLDSRQTISRDTLSQLAAATGTQLDSLLRSINAEVTPPLVMSENSPADLIVNIGAVSVANPETGRQKSITPISNLIPTFAGGTITLDATGAGNATPSAGSAIALGMSASQFLKIGISLDANGDLVLQSGVAGASEAAATNPPIVPNTQAIGYIVVETDGSNNVQNIEAADIYQYYGSGGGGSGSGSANSDLETIKNMSDDSNWEFHTPYSFESDADSLVDGSSTGEFSLVSTRFVFDAVGETLVTAKMIDDEFTDLGRNIPELEAVLIYDIDNIDGSPTVEVSRDGGSLWEAADVLERVGDATDTYYARHTFTDSESEILIDGDLTTDGYAELNVSDAQSYAQKFSFIDGSGAQVVKRVQMGIRKNGSPLGKFQISIHEDDTGSPGVMISKSASIDIAGATNGVQSVDVEQVVVKDNADYWLVMSTDAEYKSNFVASTTSMDVSTQSAGSNAVDYDGSTWSAIAGGLQFGIRGFELDLRMRITSSDPTGDNADNEFRLRSIGLFYDRQLNGIVGLKKIDRFDFSTGDNLNSFTMSFVPDPELLNIYYTQTGQVFKIDNKNVFLSNKTVTFPVNTFDGGGSIEDVTLIFAELQGTSFDNSDSNAGKIATIEADMDALGEKTESLDMVSVADISVPHTEIAGRAPIKDLSKIPAPKMGIERIIVDSVTPISTEKGPAGQVVKTIVRSPDSLDRIRLIGDWTIEDSANGTQARTSATDAFIEVVFYGTGLNFLTIQDGSERGFNVSVDGGSASAVSVLGSGVLNAREYTPYMVKDALSGLSLGLHTAKLIPINSNVSYFAGIEIINDSAQLDIPAGDVIRKDEKLSIPASSIDYNSDFDASSDALGTKGGHVVVYGERQLDGSISVKKRFKAVDVAQANLASADHSNEELVRKINFREFGAGRADDFSTLSTSDSDRAFTLDDGVTTLIGDPVRINGSGSSDDAFVNVSGFFTLTFVGTGLDINNSEENTSSYTYAVEVDGVSIGSIVNPDHGITSIVSGLPYGTHTVKVTTSSAAAFAAAWNDFYIYGPAKPSIPADAVELGSYNLMADFTAINTASAEAVSNGVIRQYADREVVYNGTWSLLTSTSRPRHLDIRTSTNTDYLEYTFFGTGFEYRSVVASDRGNITIAIDGVNYTGAATTFGTGVTWTSGSSTLDMADASVSEHGGISVSGLSLGLHTVRFTKASGSLMGISAMDVITPVHVPDADRNLLPPLRLVGSNSVKSEIPLSDHKQEKQHFVGGVDLGPNKIKWQRKYLTSNQTSDGEMTDLTFRNLEVGKTYRYESKFQLFVNDGASNAFVDVTVNHDGAIIERHGITLRGGGTTAESVRVAGQNTFVATATSLTFSSSSTSASSYVGSGDDNSYVVLEELPNHTETDEW